MPDTPDRDAIRRRWEAPTPDYGVRMSKMAPSQYAATQALADDLMQARKDIAALLVYTERLEKALKEISMRRWEDRQPGDAEDAVPYGAVSRVLTIARAALARREGGQNAP